MAHTLRTRAFGVILVLAALALLQFVLMQGAAVMDFGSLTGGIETADLSARFGWIAPPTIVRIVNLLNSWVTQAVGLAILAALGLATLGGTLIFLIRRYGVTYTIAW